MHQTLLTTAAGLLGLSLAAVASADTVNVTILGHVEYNQINSAPLNAVHAGDPAKITFAVNSNNFLNNPNFPTRGYPLTQFKFIMGSVTTGLKAPFPGTPYFVIRDNDPAVDGFMLSKDLSLPVGLPLNVQGLLGPFGCGFYVTYDNNPLPSLNVLDALGTYEYDGLTVFYWAVQDGGFEPLGMIFDSITLTRSADIDGNHAVDAADLGILLGAWGSCRNCANCSADLNGDCSVDAQDLAILLGAWT
ncbi:MAG: hypothetical protein U0572_15065 [Phycisphaerales bacterium]